jgi:hypothetical protein
MLVTLVNPVRIVFGATWDDSTKTEKLYMNGAYIVAGADSFHTLFSFSTCYIGRPQSSGGTRLKAYLKDFKLYGSLLRSD